MFQKIQYSVNFNTCIQNNRLKYYLNTQIIHEFAPRRICLIYRQSFLNYNIFQACYFEMNPKKEQGQAVPFIMIDEKIIDGKPNYKFVLDQRAIQVFTSDKVKNKKISVAAVAGPQRTGKSFLANRLLKRMNGFAIGPTTMPCTKGLWIWGQPIKLSNDEVLIIIDTEGLNSVQREMSVDSKIFALSILLSSVFIYNSIGHIDEKTLQTMSCVLKITQSIKVSTNKNNEENQIAKYFPVMYWVLRDFSLDLRGMTEQQYLQSALRPVDNPQSQAKNQIRNKIRKLFTERNCQCFPRPITDEDKLAYIQGLNYQQLRPAFREKMAQFQRKFYHNLPIKLVNGKPLTGQIFVHLCQEYIEAMNGGKIPQILTSLQRVISAQARKITQNYINAYRVAMKQLMKQQTLPRDEIEIEMNHKRFCEKIKKQIDEKFRQWYDVGKTQQLVKQLWDTLESELKDKLAYNSKVSENKCMQVFERLFGQLPPDMESVDNISSSLVMDIFNQYREKIKQFMSETKQPLKYIYFSQRFPKEIFRYMELLIIRIRSCYGDQHKIYKNDINELKKALDQAKRLIKSNQQLLQDKQKQIQSMERQNKNVKRQVQKLLDMKSFEQEHGSKSEGKFQKLSKQLNEKNLNLQKQNDEFRQIIAQLQNDLKNKQKNIQIIQKQKVESETEPTTARQQRNYENVPNELLLNLADLSDKLTSINQYYTQKMGREMDPSIAAEIDKIRKDKHVAIERRKQQLRHQKQQARREFDKMKQLYQNKEEKLKKYVQMLKQKNMDLNQRLKNQSIPENRSSFMANQIKKLEDTIRQKQSTMNSLAELGITKQKQIDQLQKANDEASVKIAELSAEILNYKSYRESFQYILRQTLRYINKKGSNLTHSLKSLDDEDRKRIMKILGEYGIKPN